MGLQPCARTTGRPAQGCDYCNYPGASCQHCNRPCEQVNTLPPQALHLPSELMVFFIYLNLWLIVSEGFIQYCSDVSLFTWLNTGRYRITVWQNVNEENQLYHSQCIPVYWVPGSICHTAAHGSEIFHQGGPRFSGLPPEGSLTPYARWGDEIFVCVRTPWSLPHKRPCASLLAFNMLKHW